MAYNRISARRSSQVVLPVTISNGGVLADPFSIYKVDVYCGKVAPEALVYTTPAGEVHPTGVTRDSVGKYSLAWDVPANADTPNVYFDVWRFFSSNPGGPLADNESKLISVTNRFWVYPEDWYADGGLQSIRLGFEALDIRFRKPEVRPLEVGLMPLPLYDYNKKLVDPILPYVSAKINIWTANNEPIIEDADMAIKLRQGSYRSNPFVLSYMLNTSTIFIGSYRYRVTVMLPDGSTRVSQDFSLDVL